MHCCLLQDIADGAIDPTFAIKESEAGVAAKPDAIVNDAIVNDALVSDAIDEVVESTAPKFTQLPQDIKALEGGEIRITCQISGM